MTALFYFLICALATAVLAIPRRDRDDLCIEVNRHTENKDLERQIEEIGNRFFEGSARPQREFGAPPLDPLFIQRAGPYQVRLLRGQPPVRVELRNVTVEGYSGNVVERIWVTGNGNIRRVRQTFVTPRTVIRSAQFRVIAPVIRGSFRAVFNDLAISEDVLIASVGIRILEERATVRGESEIEIKHNRLPIYEDAITELVERALAENEENTAEAFYSIVRDEC